MGVVDNNNTLYVFKSRLWNYELFSDQCSRQITSVTIIIVTINIIIIHLVNSMKQVQVFGEGADPY